MENAPLLNDNLQTMAETIAKIYLKGDLAIFTGSGTSIPSGLPNWTQLINRLILAMAQYDADYAQDFVSATPEQLEILSRKYIAYIRYGFSNDMAVANYIKNQLAEKGLNLGALLYPALYLDPNYTKLEPMEQQLKQPFQQDLHKHLILLAVDNPGMIWTLNYDNLFQLAANDVNKTYETIQMYSQGFDNADIAITHLHGFLPYGDEEELKKSGSTLNLTLAEDDFFQIANEQTGWANLEFMRLFMKHQVLILGMSLEDTNLRRILNTTKIILRPKVKRPWHFALMSQIKLNKEDKKIFCVDKEKETIKKLSDKRKNHWQNYNLEVIEYPSHSFLTPFIYRLRYLTFENTPGALWQKGHALGYAIIDAWNASIQHYVTQELLVLLSSIKVDLTLDDDELVEMGIFLIKNGGKEIELTFRAGSGRQAKMDEKIFSIDIKNPTGLAGRVFVAGVGVRVPRDDELHDFGLSEVQKSSKSVYKGILSFPIIDWEAGGIPLGVVYITIKNLDGKIFKNDEYDQPIIDFDALFLALNTNVVQILKKAAKR